MASMKRPRLKAVEVLPEFVLRLAFIDGSISTVDFKRLFARSPGLAPLADAHAFAKAQVVEGEGWTVEWPELDIQIGADTLWLEAQAQNAPDEKAASLPDCGQETPSR